MNTFEGATVLVTGASSGIGEAFARNLAEKRANLILTARSGIKLEQIADELRRTCSVSIHVLPADLSSKGAAKLLFEQIKASDLSVDVLINNAGFGKWAHFLGEDLDTYRKMLSLNIDALVDLTYLSLPDMLARRKGGVINVASTAGFQPVPYIAVYSASKAFVLNFTEALTEEYREHGIRFLALCPGYTATNFMHVANAHAEGLPFMSAKEVAAAGLNAFLQGRGYHVPGLSNYLTSLFPRFLSRAASNRIVARIFKGRVAPVPV